MSEFIFIDSPVEIDLNQDAVIEASAGTGKTYTIIELVLRLLTVEKMSLDQILLVTFTDKATAELRSRIREGIHDAIKKFDENGSGVAPNAVAIQAHLDRALKQVSSAPIYTINAFCQNMLREFAFEQGGVFEFELVDDQEVFKQQLNQLKRQWPSDPSIKKAFNKLGKSAKEVEELLLDLLGNINLERDLLWPASTENLAVTRGKISAWLEDFDFDAFTQELEPLESITAKVKTNMLKNVTTAWATLNERLKHATDDSDYAAEFKSVYSSHLDISKACLFKYHKDWSAKAPEDEQSNAPKFNEMIEQLSHANQQFVGADFDIIQSLLKDITQKAIDYKLNNGLISYDDMINRLHEQIMAERRLPVDEQLLTQQLRQKFTVAMIDEFQDTSFNQWEIFKTLFFESTDHQLTVIGDPKQAIYAFRGADVHTYIDAKDDMLGIGQAKGYRLATNYRSLPDLLESFNQFFGDELVEQGSWWQADAVAVKSAPDEHIAQQGPMLLLDSNSNNDTSATQAINDHAINSYGIQGEGFQAEDFKQSMANQVALLVQQHILSQPIQVKLKGKNKTLGLSDVCVLVNAATEAEFLEKAFTQLAIPYNYHKKKDLYSSDEALHYQIVLTALAHDNDRRRVNNALVTLFFGLKPAQLQDFADELLPEVNQHWLALKEAAADGDWLRLFDLLLHESGVLMRASHQGLTRRVANLKHIKQLLCETALAQNLDVKGLLQWLIEKREAKASEDLHQKDNDRQAVNIMTMHVSKGLEFPVVFLFGGFGSGKSTTQKYTKYRDKKSGQIVYDVNKNTEAEFAYDAEERQRLFYVAMTRAVFKLFLPVYDKAQYGEADKSHYWHKVVNRLMQLRETQTESWSQPIIKLDDSEMKPLKPAVSKQGSMPNTSLSPLSPPKGLWQRQRKVYSFSSLSHSKQSSRVKDGASFGEASQNEKTAITGDAVAQGPQLVTEAADWTKVLPGGVKTGHVLHGIFEHVDFQRFNQIPDLASLWQDERIMSVVDAQMEQFSMDNGDILNDEGEVVREHRQELAAWVWHTLKKPLAALNGGTLADVLPENRCHEMSFFWQKEQTHLTGFIDLLFGVKCDPKTDKGSMDYFILDWKSNFSAAGYAPEVLNQEVMAAHQYHWQYELYGMAVQKWFDSLGLENARLAGAIYLFSRGIDCQSDDQNGVYYDDFSQSNYDDQKIETELLTITQSRIGGQS
ncbi:UvrD-helicase domain-containing protein [Marinicella rhabdoformis]|uniref:UvrD-helicase domain-containing protein n=1 Tax=Marinicella rhabdoformis TaxID=2580566 RepID=UPI0015D09712|nr:UvrD-helicase domain-containing protein [Marinicella rhabdoformis]